MATSRCASNLGAWFGERDAVLFHGAEHVDDRLQSVAVDEERVRLTLGRREPASV